MTTTTKVKTNCGGVDGFVGLNTQTTSLHGCSCMGVKSLWKQPEGFETIVSINVQHDQ